MIESLKELLGSEDKDLVKQGIDLILNLGMEETLYLGFKDLLDDSDLIHLQMGPQFKKLCPHNDLLAQLVFLSLISVIDPVVPLIQDHVILTPETYPLNYLRTYDITLSLFKHVSHLELYGLKRDQVTLLLQANPQITSLTMKECTTCKKVKIPDLKSASFEGMSAEPIASFLKVNPQIEDLRLEKIEGNFPPVPISKLNTLELRGGKWSEIKQILEVNPQVKALIFSDQYSINWSEAMDLFSTQLECLSLSWIDIRVFFNEDQYGTLLPLSLIHI